MTYAKRTQTVCLPHKHRPGEGRSTTASTLADVLLATQGMRHRRREHRTGSIPTVEAWHSAFQSGIWALMERTVLWATPCLRPRHWISRTGARREGASRGGRLDGRLP